MKKLIALIALALTLTACGGDQKPKETKEEVKQEEGAKEENKEETKEEPKENNEEVKEEVQEVNEDDIYSYVGKTFDNDVYKIDVIKAGRVDQTYNIGPVNLTVYGVITGRMKDFDEEYQAYYDTDEPVDTAMIFYSVENTEDKNLHFYVGQSPITTDTKEQIDPDLFAGLEGGGEMLGQVEKDGASLFYPKNAEDIKEITWHINSVNDENFQDIAKGIKIKFTFNDKGDQVTAEEIK